MIFLKNRCKLVYIFTCLTPNGDWRTENLITVTVNYIQNRLKQVNS